jgi:hypothetical protein
MELKIVTLGMNGIRAFALTQLPVLEIVRSMGQIIRELMELPHQDHLSTSNS